MSEPAQQRMKVAEFLSWNDGTDTRYELIDGRPIAMSPVSPNHSVVVANVTQALGTRLASPCYVGNEAGVRRPDRDDTFYEADIVISCTPIDAGADTIPDPVVIIEVLSPTTLEHDRGRKAPDYREVPSVQEIVLVSSEQRRVEIWRRRGAKWELEDLIGDASLDLETVEASIPLAPIYAETAF